MSRLNFAKPLLAALMVASVLATAGDVSADTSVSVTDRCSFQAGEEIAFNVLVLLDASGSLERTDPGKARRAGLEALIESLAEMESTWATVDAGVDLAVTMAVDSFATEYEERIGWVSASEARTQMAGQFDAFTEIAEDQRFTDYRQALRGAAQRFNRAPGAGGCNLFLWFTDGEHATAGTSSHVSAAEWDEIDDLCSSLDMRGLAGQKVWTQAVFLSDGSTQSGALSYLFGETDQCEHELSGEISQLDAEGLRNTLDELIAEAVTDVGCEEGVGGLLPGESTACVDPNDMEPCSDNASIPGNGTADSPCEYSFPLTVNDESFRLAADFTYLNRRILVPENIHVDLVSPSGQRESLLSPDRAAVSSGDAAYTNVPQFWFKIRWNYNSRWEMIGHQAAERLASENGQTGWEWDGEWTLLFWGQDTAAAADAAKAAAAVRYTRRPAPETEPKFNDSGALTGFIENWPDEDNGYQEVSAHLRIDAGGEVLYPTRQVLTCDGECSPLDVSEEGRRFEVPDFYEKLEQWDGASGNGDSRLANMFEEGQDDAEVVVFVEQEFFYGGEGGETLVWNRDIGAARLDPYGILDILEARREAEEARREAEEARRAKEEARKVWLDFKVEMESRLEEGQILPYDIKLGDPPYDDGYNKVALRIEAESGLFDGRVELLGPYTPLEMENNHELKIGMNSNLQSREVSAPLGYDPEWSCLIEGTWQNSDPDTSCPPLEVDLNLLYDRTGIILTVRSEVTSTSLTDLEAELRSLYPPEPEEEWDPFWASVEAAIDDDAGEKYEEGTQPFAAGVPPPPEERGGLLFMLVALLLIAGALRAVVAWRLRPWPPLLSAEYVSIRLEHGLVDRGLPPMKFVEPETCMSLTGSDVTTVVGGIRLTSSWKALLLGQPPKILASSAVGACSGPKGAEMIDDEQVGIVGSDLKDAWVVEKSPTGVRLVVFGVSQNERLLQSQIVNAFQDALRVDRQLDKDNAETVAEPADEAVEAEPSVSSEEMGKIVESVGDDDEPAGINWSVEQPSGGNRPAPPSDPFGGTDTRPNPQDRDGRRGGDPFA